MVYNIHAWTIRVGTVMSVAIVLMYITIVIRDCKKKLKNDYYLQRMKFPIGINLSYDVEAITLFIF